MIHGYDISGYQSSSWTTETGMLFVKATEGSTFTNSRFVSQFSGAKKYATIHGAYHFARPGGSSATAQADHFISVVKPYLDTKSMLVLDLEVSKLNQAGTNRFARDFAARVRSKLPGHRLVLYMGGGYSSTNTGLGLSDVFDLWWYPRYPSTRNTTSWPSSFSPGAPVGKTGWKRPDIWQWTDNWGPAHLDANISNRSVEYLLGVTSAPKPQEDDLAFSETQLRKMIREEVVNALSADTLPSPMTAGDEFDPQSNSGFDPEKNPTWMPRSFLRQTIKGLISVSKKLDEVLALLKSGSSG